LKREGIAKIKQNKGMIKIEVVLIRTGIETGKKDVKKKNQYEWITV